MCHPDRPSRLLIAAACLVLGIAAPRPARAQTRQSGSVYVGGSVIADAKRFSGDPDTNVLDGTAAGGGVTVGTRLASRWDLEVGVDASAASEVSKPYTLTIPRRPAITLSSKAMNRATSVAVLVRYRQAPHGRVQVGFLGGLAFLRLQRDFTTEGPADTPGGLIPRPLQLVDYGAAPTVGVDVTIAIAARLSVVPAFQASAFQFPEVGGVLMRPRIGVRWTF